MKYVAVYRYDDNCFTGSLDEIMGLMNDADCKPEDYMFYELGKQVEIILQMQLVLVEKK